MGRERGTGLPGPHESQRHDALGSFEGQDRHRGRIDRLADDVTHVPGCLLGRGLAREAEKERRERRAIGSGGVEDGARLRPLPPALRRRPDRGPEPCPAGGIVDDIVICTGLHGRHCQRLGAAPREDDDREIGSERLGLADREQAIAPAVGEIGDHDLDPCLAESSGEIRAIPDSVDVGRPELAGQDPADGRSMDPILVNQEDMQARPCLAWRKRCHRSRAAGDGDEP